MRFNDFCDLSQIRDKFPKVAEADYSKVSYNMLVKNEAYCDEKMAVINAKFNTRQLNAIADEVKYGKPDTKYTKYI